MFVVPGYLLIYLTCSVDAWKHGSQFADNTSEDISIEWNGSISTLILISLKFVSKYSFDNNKWLGTKHYKWWAITWTNVLLQLSQPNILTCHGWLGDH